MVSQSLLVESNAPAAGAEHSPADNKKAAFPGLWE